VGVKTATFRVTDSDGVAVAGTCRVEWHYGQSAWRASVDAGFEAWADTAAGAALKVFAKWLGVEMGDSVAEDAK
jgi:hypothetical protein